MKRFLWLILFALVAAPWGPSAAQDAPEGASVEDLLRRLDAQEAELDALKEQVEALEEEEGPIFQAEPVPEEPPAEDDEEKIKLGFFYMATPDGDFRLDMKGRLLAEFRASDQGHADFENSFETRQVRLDFKGRLWERVTFHLALEFGGGASDAMRQGWVNLRVFDWLQLKAGQDKLPLSFSFQESFKYMNHAEWAIAIGNEAQNFELGAQLWGWLFEKRLKYVLAAFNGNGPNRRRDEDDEVDLVGRVELIPFDYLNLHVAGAFTPKFRDATGPRSGRTLGNQYTLFTVFDPDNRRRGHKVAGTAGAALRLGPFEVLAEFLFARHEDLESGATGDVTDLLVWSYFVEGVYVLTGEEKEATVAGVDSPLYDKEKGWGTGALAVSLRFEDIQYDSEAIDRGFAVGTDKARAIAATVSWWPFPVLRYSLTYNWTDFDDRVADSEGVLHGDDHIVVLRAWLTF
jgi:hypothetical protein